MTCLEGIEGEQMCSFTPSLISAVDESGWLNPLSGCFTLAKEIWYPLYRRLVETCLNGCWKSLLPSRFDPRTAQPLAGHCAIQTHRPEEYVHQKWVTVCVYEWLLELNYWTFLIEILRKEAELFHRYEMQYCKQQFSHASAISFLPSYCI